jgi:hypothetical protein
MTVRSRYAGRAFTIVHCRGALESFEKAISGLPKRKRESFTRGMILQINRLANGERMSKDNFPREGLLPGDEHHGKKHFFALKRIPVRGYCWKSTQQPNTWFISHYILKKKDKLADSDTQKVCNNWHRIEIENDER